MRFSSSFPCLFHVWRSLGVRRRSRRRSACRKNGWQWKLKIISGSWRNFVCDKFSFRREARKFNLSKNILPVSVVPVKELFMHSAFTNTAKSGPGKEEKGKHLLTLDSAGVLTWKQCELGEATAARPLFSRFPRVIYLWQAGKPLSSQHIHRSRAAFRRKFSSSMRSHIHERLSALLSCSPRPYQNQMSPKR